MTRPSVQPHDDAKRDAPSARRNAEPIFAVLQRLLPAAGTVLEIGSGTGQHAARFAPLIAPVRWQPSDPDPRAIASIRAWTHEVETYPPLPPLVLDAGEADWRLPADHDVRMIYAVNVAHITPWETTLGILAGAGRVLPAGGLLFFYGPFRRVGPPTAASNEAFDRSLRRQNPDWGVRDLDEIEAVGAEHGLELAEIVELPSNNLSVVFRRR